MAEPTSLRLSPSLVVAVAGASAQSAAIGTANPGQPGGATICRLASTTDCWIAVGENPTAAANTAGSHYLPAGVVEYVDVPFGHKVAVIQATGAGYLSISAGAK